MTLNKICKGFVAGVFFAGLAFLSEINGHPLSVDSKSVKEIGPKGGSIEVSDDETGVTVIVSFPENSINEPTLITVILHGSPFPKVIGKTHINGISVLPSGFYLQEKANISVFNPSDEVKNGMVLYHIINEQFIIPLGSQEKHVEENWLEGTFYITGKFGLGTPTASEITTQSKKLASYNPARPLAYQGVQEENLITLNNCYSGIYDLQGSGPNVPHEISFYPQTGIDPEECLRWQKALTKIEATLTWVEQHKLTGNEAAEKAEMRNAERALQEAIDGYLKKASPANRCGSYIRAAAKYLESAISLGMDPENNSPIHKHFNQLVDECSFVFTVETHEWINNPKEIHSDGSWSEEKSNWYGTIECHIPWTNFLSTGDMKVRGKGNKTLTYENHWVGDSDNHTHQTINGSWKTDRIEGAVKTWEDDYGQLHPEAHITVYWQKNVTSHSWGNRPGLERPYDFSGTDSGEEKETKSYPLKHGYEENIGNATAGMKIRVMILKSPGDGRDNPNDCF